MEATIKMTTENERILQTYLKVWEQRIINFTSDPNPNHNQDLQHFLPNFTLYAATHFPHLFRAYTKYLMLYTTKVLNHTPNNTAQIFSLLKKICSEMEDFVHCLDVQSDVVAIILPHIVASKKQLSCLENNNRFLSNFNTSVFERIWLHVEEMIVNLFKTHDNNWYIKMVRIIEELAYHVEEISLSAETVYKQFLIQELLRELKAPDIKLTRVLGFLLQLCRETKIFIERFIEHQIVMQHIGEVLEDIEIQIQLYQLFF